MTSFHKIVVAEKNNFSSNAQHNPAKVKVISKCKNGKPWKNEIRKVPAPLLRRPAPAAYLQPHILIYQRFSLPGEHTYKEFLKIDL